MVTQVSELMWDPWQRVERKALGLAKLQATEGRTQQSHQRDALRKAMLAWEENPQP